MKQKLISVITLLAMMMSIMAVSAAEKIPDDTEQKGDFILKGQIKCLRILENQEYVKFLKIRK